MPGLTLGALHTEYEERASFLAFVRDHIMLDAIYRLDSSDLKMIDVLPN